MSLALQNMQPPLPSFFTRYIKSEPLQNVVYFKKHNLQKDKLESLRNDLESSLFEQGFIINEKDIRSIQIVAKTKLLKENPNNILRLIKIARKYSINGNKINPSKIKLEIRQVESESENELLFRWWNNVWWSMPYQRPYGRQMRFIIWDIEHNAPFGLISLQSPILKQAVRDKYLKIPKKDLDYWVNRSMYAQRVGALPPYNYLIGGKMVALSLVSNEIKNAYYEKYEGKSTIMSNRMIEPELLFITTTSAFGKSSLYNKIIYNNVEIAERLGSTEGYGSFQISNELYNRLIEYLDDIGENTIRGYGGGPSKKLKLIGLACKKLGLANYAYHGIKRDYFLFSFVKNLKQVISGEEQAVDNNYSFQELFEYWKERWMKKRVLSTTQWYDFNMDTYINNVIHSLKEGFYE